MTYTILVATSLTGEAIEFLRNTPDVQFRIVEPEDVIPEIADADALITRDDIAIDVELLDAGKRLKVIGRAGAGIAGIDLEAATARGIVVMNTPGTNAISACEYTFALLLALCRQVIPAHRDLTKGIWGRNAHAGMELYGKTLGLIGLGRVGRHVAERAVAFGMIVLAYDPYVAESQVSDLRVKLVGLDEVLTRSDIISLHCALTPETYHLLDAETLEQAKPGALIVNIAHGSMIDERALADALHSGRVAGAAVDVFDHEPPGSSPLIGLPNIVHTPHMGDSTLEAQRDLSIQIAKQVIDALRGNDYRNAVNMPFVPGREFEEMAPYMRLAERIGALQHYLALGRIRRVVVEYKGDEMDGLVKPLTVALLKGMLNPVLGDRVNYINAPLLAMERGIQVSQAKGLKAGDYPNLINCQVYLEGATEDHSEQLISGALFNRVEPRILQINSYRTDFVPDGILLVFGSYDVPGVIGKVGTLMAERKINIAAWRTGRATKGGQTLTVLTLDQALPDDLLAEFRKQDYVRHANQLFLL